LQWWHAFYLFKMLGFCFITAYIYSQNIQIENFIKRYNLAFFGVAAFLISISIYQVFKFRVLESNIETLVILSTFGNVNMFAEFLILVLPMFYIWLRNEDKILYAIKALFFAALIFLLLYTRSRSAWVGMVLWFAIIGRTRLKKWEWVGASTALGLFLLSHFTAPSVDKIDKFLPASFSTRASLYQGSVQLLADKPFGTSPGQFMNEIVPYLMDKAVPAAEFAYYDQPHSEFLKWGIQFGWVFLALTIFIFSYLAYILYKMYKKDSNNTAHLFFVGSFLVLFPQVLFQFPFENPASAMYVAIVFGVFLSSFPYGRVFNLKWVKPLLAALTFVGIFNSFYFLGSIYLESHFPMSTDIMNVVCKIYPVNFKACHWKNKNLLQIKNIQAFRSEFKNDFTLNPFYCDNLRLLPEYFNYASDEKKTCEAILLYNTIYKGQRTFPLENMPICQKYVAPIEFRNPKQFSADFRQWFAQ
jgi:O-antigen ligase